MQQHLDRMFKDTVHQNVYFPLFIPLSFFEKEAQHVEGFAKECAVVTHRRLEAKPGGGLMPAGELEESLIVRPTSETIFGAAFSKWIQSYRDLPMLLNQWCNVVRWEMRTRLFLRTTEFLWQEGHTAHATAEEAKEETLCMLEVYARFAEDYMALPVIKGEKCSWERFPGAVDTYCIEAMMQDRKALQAGTSHFLGQNFARASDIKFQNEQGREEYVWTTSWGMSTRMIGALIMTHADDDGLVIPPRIAPRHVVILPIHHNEADRVRVLEYCQKLALELRAQPYCEGRVRVEIDSRDMRGGDKMWHHIKRGMPLRIEVGPRDLDAGTVMLSRRDRVANKREAISDRDLVARIGQILDEMQSKLLQRAVAYRDAHIREITDRQEFERWFPGTDDTYGGFALCPFVDDPVMVEQLVSLKVSVRCIPFEQLQRSGTCLFTGRSTNSWAIFAKSY
ncbi:prolyl-tRNA synthetase [Xylophilus ampelinus]|uniref:Proline--tRNA ligase n=2 Tax=Xylophilus ampelinus TaxID=54067 RepID=A0A318SP51_9BURK|nr:prolyl-tRNA synthetase [Xylophilus ampelinus]